MELSQEFKEYLTCREVTPEAAIIALMEFLRESVHKTVWISTSERRVLIITK